MTATTDAALAAQAARGSAHAFRALYRAYVRPVYWLAHGILGSAADAEDIVQETFLTAWRKLPGLELRSPSLLPWLVTICRFHCANRVRIQRREREHTVAVVDETLAAGVDVEDLVIGADLAERILREVAGLDELDREVFRLCAIEGRPYQHAADALGVAHGVVRNRLSRVRTRLRTVTEETP